VEVAHVTDNEKKKIGAELDKLSEAVEKIQESADVPGLKDALEAIYNLLEKIISEEGWQ